MDWTDIGSIATAIGVFLGVLQIRQNLNLRRAQYEDSLDQQYRSLAMEIPVDALIGKHFNDSLRVEVRELVYNYLDRVNLTRFHGVFAPNSHWRAEITPAGRGTRRAAVLCPPQKNVVR